MVKQIESLESKSKVPVGEIHTREELVALLAPDGRLATPARLGAGRVLSGLTSVTSVAGLTMGEDCVLRGLTSVTSLAGLTMGEGCVLSGLTEEMEKQLNCIQTAGKPGRKK